MTDTIIANGVPPTAKTKYRPMTFDSLRVHASKLDLESKVSLVKELKEQIEIEVQRLRDAAQNASTMASTLAGTLAGTLAR